MAGPCSVESEEQLLATARAVKAAGATSCVAGLTSRGPPRTSFGDRQGRAAPAPTREKGDRPQDHHRGPQRARRRARGRHGRHPANRHAQSQNFQLLIEAARTASDLVETRHEPANRGMAAQRRIHPGRGQPERILCERGIRTFETYTRNTLDLAAVAIAKKECHLPVIVDPSQGCGRAHLVG